MDDAVDTGNGRAHDASIVRENVCALTNDRAVDQRCPPRAPARRASRTVRASTRRKSSRRCLRSTSRCRAVSNARGAARDRGQCRANRGARARAVPRAFTARSACAAHGFRSERDSTQSDDRVGGSHVRRVDRSAVGRSVVPDVSSARLWNSVVRARYRVDVRRRPTRLFRGRQLGRPMADGRGRAGGRRGARPGGDGGSRGQRRQRVLRRAGRRRRRGPERVRGLPPLPAKHVQFRSVLEDSNIAALVWHRERLRRAQAKAHRVPRPRSARGDGWRERSGAPRKAATTCSRGSWRRSCRAARPMP